MTVGWGSTSRLGTAPRFLLSAATIIATIGFVWPGTAGATTVRVEPGGTLSQIADTYGTSVTALVAANGIANPNLVLAGAVLQIPPASASGTSLAAPTGATIVTVAPGDSLWSIAARFGTTVTALVSENGIVDSSQVLIGAKLIIPERSTAIAVQGTGSGSLLSTQVDNMTLPAALVAHPDRLALLPLFQKWAEHFDVPAPLIEAMCWWESGWQTTATSSTGAIGVGQLEPATVSTLRLDLGNQSLDPTDASDNIEMAAAYLRQLLNQTGGNEGLALAGYNQGLTSLRRNGTLPSTSQYVHGILTSMPAFS
jgi:N-acetylmuramoyl-L-alanine amidase